MSSLFLKTSLLTVDKRLFKDLNILPVLQPEHIANFERKDTALGLIVNSLTMDKSKSRISYPTLLDYLTSYIYNSLDSGKIDHGIFTAIIVLNRVHKLYSDNPSWDIKDFYYEVVDSATAIFLHNVCKYSGIKDFWRNGTYHYDFPSPLGYLLFVTDTLCEWLRSGNSDAEYFHISKSEGKIIFKVAKTYREKMEMAINLFDKDCPINVEFY